VTSANDTPEPDKPKIDLERNARILRQVLELAERLPYRPSPDLQYPPLNRLLKRDEDKEEE